MSSSRSKEDSLLFNVLRVPANSEKSRVKVSKVPRLRF